MEPKTTMKMGAVIASSFMLMNVAQAATPGAYAGIGLGVGKINSASKSVFNIGPAAGSVSSTSGGLGGKLFAGYNFTPYFGAEAAYSLYPRTLNKATSGSSSASTKYTMSAISLVGKAYLPIEQQFNVYALGGIAEVYSTVNYSNNSNGRITTNNNVNFKQGSTTTRKLRPIYGIGASYDINPHVTAGVELSHIQGNGNTNTSAKAIPSANMLTLTAAYNFG
jgi:opacity protein-like surface antigen